MARLSSSLLRVTLGLLAVGVGSPAAAGPEGQMTWGVHVSLAPAWFDPAETLGLQRAREAQVTVTCRRSACGELSECRPG